MTVAELIKDIILHIMLGIIGGFIGAYLVILIEKLWQQRNS
jgi:uncharacterized membrane protein YeaQ/YmgE (transglycosylase-associated protein family)